jgi:hypothetical protein
LHHMGAGIAANRARSDDGNFLLGHAILPLFFGSESSPWQRGRTTATGR